MQVGSVLEVYTTIYGWEIYNTFVDLLYMTGLMWAPVLAIIYRNWKGPVTSQENRAAAATSLSRMQFDIYSMLVVIIFALYPIIPLTLTDVDHTQICSDPDSGSVQENTVDENNTTYSDTVGVATTTKVPVFWSLIMSIGSGINYHMSGKIKCFDDIPMLDEKIRNIIITDEKVSKEYSRFVTECYVPAKNKYENAMDGKQYAQYISDELDAGRPGGAMGGLIDIDYDKDDPYTVGSHFYQETPGFYKPADDAAIQGFSFRAAKPIEGWLYDSTRDKSYTPDMLDANEPGSPYCDEWWNHQTIGLKKKLLDAIDTVNPDKLIGTTFYEEVKAKIQGWAAGTTDEQVEDLMLKRLQRFNDQDMTGTNAFIGGMHGITNGSNIGERLGNLVKTTGTTIGGFFAAPKIIGTYTEMAIAKQAAPMAQAIILFVVYIMLAAIMVISCYDLKALFTCAFLVLSVQFFTTLWAIAEYLDTALFTAIYPDVSIWGSIGTMDYKRLILDMILTGMVVFGPALLIVVMGVTGYQFGRIASSFGDSIANPKDAGKSGGEGAGKAAQKAIAG